MRQPNPTVEITTTCLFAALLDAGYFVHVKDDVVRWDCPGTPVLQGTDRYVHAANVCLGRTADTVQDVLDALLAHNVRPTGRLVDMPAEAFATEANLFAALVDAGYDVSIALDHVDYGRLVGGDGMLLVDAGSLFHPTTGAEVGDIGPDTTIGDALRMLVAP